MWASGLLASPSVAIKEIDISFVTSASLLVTNFRKIFKDGAYSDLTNVFRKSNLCFSESLESVAFRARMTFLEVGFMSE